MHKIPVSKNDGVAEIVEEIIGANDEEITLVISKGSALGESESNFRLIKREADSAGKSVFVESVDDGILSLAHSSGLRATHSLFGKEKSSEAFMDIIPSGHKKGIFGRGRGWKTKEDEHSEQEEKQSVKLHVLPEESGVNNHNDDSNDNGSPPYFPEISRSRVFAISALFAFLAGVAWLLSYPFARATIEINFENIPWSYEGAMVVDVSVSSTNVEKSIIPAELFTMEKNMTHLFAASGKDKVERKAKGTIWIFNAYSSSPQVLVATTRFEAPDGKVFRIVDQITVPGAEIKDGKIIPSSIEADIVADKPGVEYNVGPISRLSVPGFKGTPRFNGFYGETKSPMSGGFIGEKPVPTTKDVDAAKARVAELLTVGLKTTFSASAPDDFKILDGATEIEIKKISVDSNTNEEGKFSVFGEATMRAFGFRESDVIALLAVLADKGNPDSDFKELNVNYSDIKPDFGKGFVSLSINAQSVLWPEFSKDKFRAMVVGKSIEDVRSEVSAMGGLVGAKVSVWPIWLRSIPGDAGKVNIVVN